MFLTRRAVIAGVGAGMTAAIAAPTILRAAETGARRFVVLRDGDDIGFQTNKVTKRGDVIVHECQARLKVKVLGITAYRYELDYVEEWKGGQLLSMTSKCYDDGEDDYVNIKRGGEALEIDGSGYQGPCPLGVATSSYWSYEFMQRPTWISTQTGALLTMNAKNAGATEVSGPNGAVSAERWIITGGYDVEVFYKDRDWVSIAFDAGGEPARYVPDSTNSQFMPVWDA